MQEMGAKEAPGRGVTKRSHKYDDQGRSLILGPKTRWKGGPLGQLFKGPLRIREQDYSLWREDAHHPAGLRKGCAFQKGKVLHFFLWSSQGPGSWVGCGQAWFSILFPQASHTLMLLTSDTSQYISRVTVG